MHDQYTQIPLIVTERQCTHCGEMKPLDAFSPYKAGRFGVRAACRECRSAKKAEWYKEHREQVLAHNRADPSYQERHRENVRRYTERHREARNAHRRTEEVRQKARDQDAKWRAEHREQYRATRRTNGKKRRLQPEYREVSRHCANRYRARKISAPINDFTLAQWEAIKEAFDHRCAYCGCLPERLTQDHVIPLSRGGSHTASNIVPACTSCNCSKNARTPEEWNGPHGRRLAKQTRSP